MKKLLSFFPFLLLLFAFSGCSTDPSKVYMRFDVNAGSAPLEYNTNYTVNGSVIQFTLVKFYVSEIGFQKTSGEYLHFSDRYLLVNADSTNDFYVGELEPGNYNAVQFGLGVDSARNTENGSLAIPAYDYPDDHPLNAAAQMYWAWNPGYIWMKLEGKIDLNNNGSFADAGETFGIHTGLDPAYRVIEKSIGIASEGNDMQLVATADILRFFDSYDLVTQRNAHPMSTGSAEFGYVTQIVNNAVNVFTISVQ
jgi:hypothetical protein